MNLWIKQIHLFFFYRILPELKSHLTKEKRIQIETLINLLDENGQRQYSNAAIARIIGVHRSTITRELKRIKSKINIRSGKIKNKPYNADDAQEDYLKRII